MTNIFGSCVTRDIFRHKNKDKPIGTYLAKRPLHYLVLIPDFPKFIINPELILNQ